jgi:hypothetical protein
MLLAALRILFGLLLACIAAGLVLVGFVTTPADLATLDSANAPDQLIGVGLLAAYTATHAAIFAVPFGLIAALLGEWQGIRSWGYYMMSGLIIAALGLMAQYTGETGGLSILNPYAVAAFAAAGLAAGWIYWLASGRFACQRDNSETLTRGPSYDSKPEAKDELIIADIEVKSAHSKRNSPGKKPGETDT